MIHCLFYSFGFISTSSIAISSPICSTRLLIRRLFLPLCPTFPPGLALQYHLAVIPTPTFQLNRPSIADCTSWISFALLLEYCRSLSFSRVASLLGCALINQSCKLLCTGFTTHPLKHTTVRPLWIHCNLNTTAYHSTAQPSRSHSSSSSSSSATNANN